MSVRLAVWPAVFELNPVLRLHQMIQNYLAHFKVKGKSRICYQYPHIPNFAKLISLRFALRPQFSRYKVAENRKWIIG